MNADTLKTKTRAELLEICANLNIKAHHKAKDETLIERILSQPVAYQNEAMRPAADRIAPDHDNTPDQVLEAIKTYAAKDGFKANFNEDQSTWHFSYRGREDSGTLKMPMKVIVMKAEQVSRGALHPPMDKDRNGPFMWAAR